MFVICPSEAASVSGSVDDGVEDELLWEQRHPWGIISCYWNWIHLNIVFVKKKKLDHLLCSKCNYALVQVEGKGRGGMFDRSLTHHGAFPLCEVDHGSSSQFHFFVLLLGCSHVPSAALPEGKKKFVMFVLNILEMHRYETLWLLKGKMGSAAPSLYILCIYVGYIKVV